MFSRLSALRYRLSSAAVFYRGMAFRLLSMAFRLPCVVFRLSGMAFRLPSVVFRLLSMAFRLSGMVFRQCRKAILCLRKEINYLRKGIAGRRNLKRCPRKPAISKLLVVPGSRGLAATSRKPVPCRRKWEPHFRADMP